MALPCLDKLLLHKARKQLGQLHPAILLCPAGVVCARLRASLLLLQQLRQRVPEGCGARHSAGHLGVAGCCSRTQQDDRQDSLQSSQQHLVSRTITSAYMSGRWLIELRAGAPCLLGPGRTPALEWSPALLSPPALAAAHGAAAAQRQCPAPPA